MRTGLAADVVMIALDAAVAFGLYRLPRPVCASLAIAATAFRLIQAVILGSNLRNALQAWGYAQQAVDTGAAGAAERALQAMETFALTYDVAMTATGVVYLIGSFDVVLGGGLSSLIDPLYGIAIVAEPAFAIWLIVKGVAVTGRDAALRPQAIAA